MTTLGFFSGFFVNFFLSSSAWPLTRTRHTHIIYIDILPKGSAYWSSLLSAKRSRSQQSARYCVNFSGPVCVCVWSYVCVCVCVCVRVFVCVYIVGCKLAKAHNLSFTSKQQHMSTLLHSN